MKKLNPKHIKVLGLAPSSYGCGFAVMERESKLVALGVKTVKGKKKNAFTLMKVKSLIADYKPDVVVIEDTRTKESRRSPRIRALIEKIVTLAKSEKITVKRYSRKELNLAFLSDERRTKHDLAEFLAARFPEDLMHRLPRKPRIWESDDCRMDIFDAVALAEHYLRIAKQMK